MTNIQKREVENVVRETILAVLPDAFDQERNRRIARNTAEVKPEPEPKIEKKLYLISMSGDRLAFPMDNGNAVLHQSFYGWMDREKGTSRWIPDTFKTADIEVVAFSDARRLKNQINVSVFNNMVGVVEVQESVIREI